MPWRWVAWRWLRGCCAGAGGDGLAALGHCINAPLLLLEDGAHSQQGARLHALGKTGEARALHITFTLRQSGALIRVNSARDMHRKERAIYDQAH
jgi:uncharacterized DUF497 family protein